MLTLIVLGVLWTAIFIALPKLFKRSIRNDFSQELPGPRLAGDMGPVPMQIMFAEVHPDHVRVDCVQLSQTSEHEAGFPVTLRIARPEHPTLDGVMTRTLTDFADKLATVELRFAQHEGEPRVRIERNRTSMTFDLGAAA